MSIEVHTGTDEGVATPKEVHHGLLARVAGLALMAGSAGTFSIVTLMVSLMATEFPMYEIVAVRFFTQWSCAAITLLAQWQSVAVPREFWLGMVARSVFGVASMVFFYLSLEHLAMANASVIRFTSPAMVTILAWLLFKEKFGWTNAVSTVLSLLGVVLVAQPAFLFGEREQVQSSGDAKGGGDGTPEQIEIATAFAFVAAVAAALAFLAIRRVNALHPMVITFWFSLTGFVVLTPMALAVNTIKSPTSVGSALLLTGTGVVGYVGQWFMCRSLQLEEAGPATMMRYLDVAFAFLFQITVEHRSVDWLSPVGACLVVSGAGVVTLQRWCAPPPEEEAEEPLNLNTPARRRWRSALHRITAIRAFNALGITQPEHPLFPGHGKHAALLAMSDRHLLEDF